VDHIIPRSAGGPHAIENLTAACPDCQQRKAAGSLLTFLLATLRDERIT
jgi:5-methylcytosine-specific restriction endonuclease McrA